MRPRLSWPGAQHGGHSLEVASLATAMWSLGAQTRSFQRQSPDPPGGVPDCCCDPGRRVAQECKSWWLKAGLGPVWIGGMWRAWESWWAGASLGRTSGSYLAWGAVTRMGQAALRPLGVGQRRAGQLWCWLGWGRSGMGAGAWPGGSVSPSALSPLLPRLSSARVGEATRGWGMTARGCSTGNRWGRRRALPGASAALPGGTPTFHL